MSDFISPFWSGYVMAIVGFGIVFCVGVLWFGFKARAETAEDRTTGHVWDGDLREVNNPLPRWWVGMYVLTVIFAIAYVFMYPGFGGNKGSLGWSSKGQYEAEHATLDKQVAPLFAKYAAMPIEEIAKDKQAVGMGQRLFVNNCAQCHGTDAKGGLGYPNLTDKFWLWGGNPDQIQHSIDKGREGVMPSQTAAIGGTPADAKAVVNYVMSLSGLPHDTAQAAIGKTKFAACAACHNADGTGNPALGAPNLTQTTWLLGVPSEANIVKQISQGSHRSMPAWEGKFTPEQIRLLTAYVWGLSNK